MSVTYGLHGNIKQLFLLAAKPFANFGFKKSTMLNSGWLIFNMVAFSIKLPNDLLNMV